MTTNDVPGGSTVAPPPPPPPAPPARLLRRSRSDRIAAGVAGGLGRYFNLDPVLFRVLFAVSAFFGGAGILAYLLAWAAIPDEETGTAPIDGWVRGLRERRVPVWAVAIGAVLLLWIVAFSWWAPGPFFPVMIVVIVLVAVFARRDRRGYPPAGSAYPTYPPPYPTAPAGTTPPVDDPTAPDAPTAATATDAAGAPTAPQWVYDSQQWVSESRAAGGERRRRALPLRIGTLVALVVTLTILGIADAVSGISFAAYFWAALAVVGVGLLTGLVLRRTPWSMTILLVPTVLGLIGFAGTRASLHDGTGDRNWTPTTSLSGSYDLAFGQGTLDLSQLTGNTRNVTMTMAAGRIDIIVPRSMPVTVEANVRWGQIVVDGSDLVDNDDRRGNGGYNVHRTISAPAGSTGSPFTIDVHLSDGEINIQHV